MKNWEGLGTLIMWMTSGGCEVDIEEGGMVPKYALTWEQVSYSPTEWSHEHLGSCLVVECLMMKSSTLFKCGPRPCPSHICQILCSHPLWWKHISQYHAGLLNYPLHQQIRPATDALFFSFPRTSACWLLQCASIQPFPCTAGRTDRRSFRPAS